MNRLHHFFLNKKNSKINQILIGFLSSAIVFSCNSNHRIESNENRIESNENLKVKSLTIGKYILQCNGAKDEKWFIDLRPGGLCYIATEDSDSVKIVSSNYEIVGNQNVIIRGKFADDIRVLAPLFDTLSITNDELRFSSNFNSYLSDKMCNGNNVAYKLDLKSVENAANLQKRAEDFLPTIIKNYLPQVREMGGCTMGNTKGEAKFTFNLLEKSVSVKYRVITKFDQNTAEFVYSNWHDEKGKLESLQFIEDSESKGYYEILGLWKNQSQAGDGNFSISLYGHKKNNTIVIQISNPGNGKWFEYITLKNEDYAKIKDLLKM